MNRCLDEYHALMHTNERPHDAATQVIVAAAVADIDMRYESMNKPASISGGGECDTLDLLQKAPKEFTMRVS